MNEVGRWLTGHGLGKYADVFAQNSVEWDLVDQLSHDDLRELGLNVGERRRYLNAVQDLGNDAARPESVPNRDAAVTRDAERRQLTVMFCDLVGSTGLSGRLDPEEFRDVVRAYQSAAEIAIQRFGGYIAQYLGDGLLVYFGYPAANEDDAQRAVHASVGIRRALENMNAQLEASYSVRLSVRIGIHTGPVVVGEMGGSDRRENLAMGETPNLAARLQGMAEPNQIVISHRTRNLLKELFELKPMGKLQLRNIPEPVEAFVVMGERSTETRFAAGQAVAFTPMVGRQQELALLLDRWRQAGSGEGQVVVLTGDAGIGKSRIMSALVEATASEDQFRVSYQCSPYHADTPLYPALQQLGLEAGFDETDPRDARFEKLDALLHQVLGDAPKVTSLLSSLLGLEESAKERYGALDMTPQQRRAGILQGLLALLNRRAIRQPVLFLIEDAHWIDPTTLELLERMLDQLAGKSVLVVVTARPNFDHSFGGHPAVTRLALNRLGHPEVVAIVERITRGKSLPSDLVDAIATRTDGVPLYVEEFTKAIIASDALCETDESYSVVGQLTKLIIPSSIHDSLMARLDRLQPLKSVTQTAACIGREFEHGLIAAVMNCPAAQLNEMLTQMVTSELIFQRGIPPDARYTFKHALVRDAAYESLLKSRRQQIHSDLLVALKARGPAQPEILAHHAMMAGQFPESAEYWEQAGDQAMSRPAFIEAIAHFERAVQSARRCGVTSEARQRELDLIVKLVLALQAGRGIAHPSVAEILDAAGELLDAVGDSPHRFRILAGRWAYENATGNPRRALLHTEGMEVEANRTNERGQQFVVYCFRAVCRFWMGDFSQADVDFDKATALHDPREDARLIEEYGVDQHIWMRCNRALSLMCRGEADSAWRMADALEVSTRDPKHVHTAGSTLVLLALLHQIARSPDWEQMAQRSLAYSLDNGLTMTERSSRFVLGGGFHDQHRYAEASEQLTENVDWLRNSGSRITLSYYLAFYASTLSALGQRSAATAIEDEVDAMVRSGSVQWITAEVNRLLADANYRDSGNVEQTIASLQGALEIADKQGARLWKLRSTVSLANVLADQGRIQDARALLSDIVDSFPAGGRQLADYIDANSLLTKLSELSSR